MKNAANANAECEVRINQAEPQKATPGRRRLTGRKLSRARQRLAESWLPFPCPPAKSRRGAESFAVKVIQNFLFHLAGRQHVSPRFFFALASEKLQVMPDLEQHRLGLTLDLFEQ